MLATGRAGVAFRHELARLAVEESVAPNRRLELHRAALAALAEPPERRADLARLAHHAEAAGDADAVLRFAPAAAARAAARRPPRGGRAVRARPAVRATGSQPAERAELLELRSHECYLTDDIDEAIEAVAGGARAAAGRSAQRLEEGEALRWLSQILWCPGRTAEARAGRRGGGRAPRDAAAGP